jgi:hypothetical protein
MIFVGEHTSYTHAWISAALESGVRGGVQLLLELGLVDEAKEAVDKWFARWISVVSARDKRYLMTRMLIPILVNEASDAAHRAMKTECPFVVGYFCWHPRRACSVGISRA